MKQNYLLALLALCSFATNAQVISFPDPIFKNQLLASSPTNDIAKNSAGVNIAVDANANGQIEVSEAAAVYQYKGGYPITNFTGIAYFTNLRKFWYNGTTTLFTSLDLTTAPFLEDFKISTSTGQLQSLNLVGLANLKDLFCANQQLTQLNLTGLASLENLTVNNNQITSIDASQSPNLWFLQCKNNQLQSLNLTGCVNLNRLYCNNNLLTTLSLNLPTVIEIDCFSNQLTTLDFSQCPNVSSINCSQNQLTSIDVSGLHQLGTLNCGVNLLTVLDTEDCSNLSTLLCYQNQLTHLFIKNGKYESSMNFSNNNLIYICTDEVNLAAVQNLANIYGFPNCVINSYCNFNPGGDFSTAQGQILFDLNGNGCISGGNYLPIVWIDVNDNASFFANSSGFYSLMLPEGTHTLTPQFENNSFFSVSPPSITLNLPMAQNPVTNTFCVTPIGQHQDLEVVFIPISDARPGFNCQYRIIYRNKGNTTQSNQITLTFDDAIFDFVSSTAPLSSQATNLLKWNFTDLHPFEARSFDLVLHLNSPTDTPPVNGGHDLGFLAVINPYITDAFQPDNRSELKQTAVNSFDPNDKTCLEGTLVAPQVVGAYVHYLIRFENTGTANAQNIVVKDMIDSAKFDVNTLIPLHGSHPFQMRVLAGNRVEFIFENIQLPFDDANNDGYIVFKIKTRATLVAGDSFSNSASIYFDYNHPIVTDPAVTTIQLLGKKDFEFASEFALYPNPTNDFLNIQSKSDAKIQSINIYNTLGQLVLAITNAETVSKMDVSDLASGNYFLKVISDKGNSNVKFIKN